jgi:hypothetical protein
MAATEEKNWFERNQKTIVITGIVVVVALLLLPDALIRKYVPWVK